MPSLVSGQDMNGFGYDRGAPRMNGVTTNGGLDNYRDDFGRDDMRRDDDDRYRRGGRNGGPSFDRFNTDYLDQNSLSDFRSNEPKFELDHLATFAAGTRNGCIHAEDGLRKLRQMENTTGIWTMRCILIVERGFLVILDNSTGEELERFPIQLVQDPTAIFKNDRREIYNNLILFTIVDDPKKRSSQADMHIFQSCKAPAQEIVDEILAARNGQQRLYQGGGGSRFPGKDAYNFQESREYLDTRTYNTGEMKQFNQTSYSPSGQYGGPISQQRSLFTRINTLREKEDLGGGSTEILERDVQLLNHCFDDIEKFVARLQQAAESYKELEKRKRDRGAKNKKRQSGDGMLNARARPPPDRDFVDIFQKFKLSFNLLAKLKAHIHDPNAPELVHFLFTPLSLIYEASRDPYHGNQNLGDMAVAPVLTSDAKQLLLNCLTSKEIELWQALGKHWTTSRDEWNGHIPPYVPEFYDGWQPAAGVIDELTARTAVMGQQQPMLAPAPMMDPARSSMLMDDRIRPYNPPAGPMHFPDEDRYHRNDFERNHRAEVNKPEPIMPSGPMTRQDENQAYYEELRRTGDTTIYEAVHDRPGKNAKELSVQKGDILQVLDSSKNWWKLRNYKGQVGFAPYTILKQVPTEPDNHRPTTISEASFTDDNVSRGASRRDSYALVKKVHSQNSKEPKYFSQLEPKILSAPYSPAVDSPSIGWQEAARKASLLSQFVFPNEGRNSELFQREQTQYSNIASAASHARQNSAIQEPMMLRSSPPLRSIPTSEAAMLDVRRSSLGDPLAPGRTKQRPESGFSQDIVSSNLQYKQDHLPYPARQSSLLPAIPSNWPEEDYPFDVELRQKEKKNKEHLNELQAKVTSRVSRGMDAAKLNANSSAEDVAAWMFSKGFSETARERLQGYTGREMFHLQFSNIVSLIGHDEAIRLDGLLRLQKTTSGYSTKSAKELNDILEKRKQYINEASDNELDEAPRLNSSGQSLRDQILRKRMQLKHSFVDFNT